MMKKISLFRFYHPIFKFDPIAFARHIRVPDDVSLQEYIIQKHSVIDARMVEQLIEDTLFIEENLRKD